MSAPFKVNCLPLHMCTFVLLQQVHDELRDVLVV